MSNQEKIQLTSQLITERERILMVLDTIYKMDNPICRIDQIDGAFTFIDSLRARKKQITRELKKLTEVQND